MMEFTNGTVGGNGRPSNPQVRSFFLLLHGAFMLTLMVGGCTSPEETAQNCPGFTFDPGIEVAVFSMSEMKPERVGSTGPGKPVEIPPCEIWMVELVQRSQLAPILPLLKEKKVSGLHLESFPTVDADLATFGELKNLQVLNLSGNRKITNAGLAQLASLKNLRFLDLPYCRQINDVGLSHVADLKGLRMLNLAECREITDAGLVYLGKLKNLEMLSLHDCRKITDAGLVHLEKLTSLKRLDLSKCGKLTPAGIKRLKKALPDARINR